MTSVEALQALAVRREPQAWAALLERHGAELLRATRGILNDDAQAQDACQETLLVLRAHAGAFDRRRRPSGHGQVGFGCARVRAGVRWLVHLEGRGVGMIPRPSLVGGLGGRVRRRRAEGRREVLPGSPLKKGWAASRDPLWRNETPRRGRSLWDVAVQRRRAAPSAACCC